MHFSDHLSADVITEWRLAYPRGISSMGNFAHGLSEIEIDMTTRHKSGCGERTHSNFIHISRHWGWNLGWEMG